MSDWLGLLFFILLLISAFAGMKILANPQKRTEAEFERRAMETTTIGVFVNVLHKLSNPAEGRAREVQAQLKEGRFSKKKREGKANSDLDNSEKN